ncbi:hypothetical protein [Polaromonas jejuensis]|uniref:Uncharacterized protein n=1 Tax=Polaromonas jejuensis TaxID=457502 RepID=A0ABW0QDM3_9BURK|nr:hypothetical protein [Polaromonas jejuensis]
MTTAVQSADYQTRTWTMASGRRYLTDVAPGSTLTAELLALAAGIHGLSGDFADVTDMVWAEMLRCRH